MMHVNEAILVVKAQTLDPSPPNSTVTLACELSASCVRLVIERCLKVLPPKAIA